MKILETIIEPSKVYVNSKFTLKIKIEGSEYRLKKYFKLENSNSILITEDNKKIITEWSEKNE